jgi:hypothetical protein
VRCSVTVCIFSSFSWKHNSISSSKIQRLYECTLRIQHFLIKYSKKRLLFHCESIPRFSFNPFHTYVCSYSLSHQQHRRRHHHHHHNIVVVVVVVWIFELISTAALLSIFFSSATMLKIDFSYKFFTACWL